MSLADRLRFLLVTGMGLGLAPVASGTFGTLGGVVLAVALQVAGLEGPRLAIAWLVAALLLLAFGLSTTAFVRRAFGTEDPKPFVLDEIVGYLAAISLYVIVCGEPSALVHVVAFFVFRFFDVAKVFPANRLEHLPGAPGIMLDDVAAGLYTGGVLVVLQALQVIV
jgi:phosphatidylglycerophosphatase A